MKKRIETLLVSLMVASMLVVGCSSGESAEPADEDNAAEVDEEEAADTTPEDTEAEEEVPERQTADDKLSIEDAIVETINPTLDGEEISVTWYEDVYLENQTIEDQLISIYIPENATEDSPIILNVNNAGWMANSYAARTKVLGTEEQTDEAGVYTSTSDDDKVGKMLSEGYVIVSYGCRSRNNPETDEGWMGHSPATITDTKAVIRYLRYNDDQIPAGDTDKIIITGTSGGGALSSVIGASGNSEDYFPSLYEAGAAGIEDNGDGTYTSTISDAVYGVLAYCPITDLPGADFAYEWTFHDTRERFEDTTEETLAASETLKDAYTDYLADWDLTLEDGSALTTDNLRDTIITLMEKEIEESIEEIGVDQMMAELDEFDNDNDVTWITINEDGSYTYDYDEHLYWLASHTALKGAPAFSAKGMGAASSEDTLFGTTEDEYSPFEFYSWDNDEETNNVGLDDTGLSWDEFIETDTGKDQLLQMRMTNALAYLNDDDVETDIAPHWYVRFGMADRDTSFAVETSLYYSIQNNDAVEDVDFEFAWLKQHMGDYDVQEAYEWLAGVL